MLGFPVALILAWMFDATPEGVRRTQAGTPGIPLPRHGWIAAALAGALVVVIALVSYQQFASAPAATASRAKTAAGTPGAAIISVAVLPFVNLSGDPAQEFFSDGMTEEITSALAKVPNLRVVGRTSAFQFKGENKDLRSIGQALSATHLIEGSVRKDGNEVRITAQLIQAGDGTHLWTQSYNRELKGVFAVQEEIAQAIAGALRVPLGLQQGDTLVRNRTNDLESYEQYLRARTLYRARAIDESIKVLEPVVARDPGFAPAWAQLARSYNLLPNYSPVLRSDPIEAARRSVSSMQAKAEMAAQEAIRLDPRYAGGYASLADVRSLSGKWAEAEDLFRQAFALDANDPDALNRYYVMLIVFRQAFALDANNPDALNRYYVMLIVEGRLKESLAFAERVRMLEPLVPVYQRNFAGALQTNGQNQASIPILESIAAGYYRDVYLARAYAAAGDYASAETLLGITGNQVSRRSVEEAERLIRTAPMKAKAPEALAVLEGELSFVYAYIGALDRVRVASL